MWGRPWIAVVLLLGSCARDNPDAERVAALEARVRALEGRLNPAGVDAGAEPDDAAVVWQAPTTAASRPQLGTYWPSSHPTVEEMEASCRAQISKQCRSAEPPAIEGGAPGQLTWGVQRPPAPAEPDRACVANGERQCKAQADELRRRNKVFPWLEQQLKQSGVDAEFTRAALDRLTESHPGHRVQLACTAKFCKAWLAERGGPWAPPVSAVTAAVLQEMGDAGTPRELLVHDGAVYVARGDYRFPDMNVSPPGPLGRRR